METASEHSSQEKRPSSWMDCFGVVLSMGLGAALGCYVGFNILIWTAPKNANWDVPGIGLAWYFFGAIGAFIGMCLGAIFFYVLYTAYCKRR